jgi:outer membrane protein OmpA-like peptidoglycan-associated protein
MRRWNNFWCCFAAMIFIAGCGHKNMVILVPDPDGSVGQVTVSNAAGSVDLNRANQSTIARDRKSAPGAPAELKPAQVQELFGQVLSNEPPPPLHFVLYFQSDSVQLLQASVQELPVIVAAIQQRSPTRVSVVGHSDTRGDKAYNLDLSRRRALAVKQQLVEKGVTGAFMDVSSHGEANPIVKTADNVANAKNRRVEVVVR